MPKFVVSPDLITRFSDGQVHLHTLETARSVTFPNLWVVNVLDHFSRPASDDEFTEKFDPGTGGNCSPGCIGQLPFAIFFRPCAAITPGTTARSSNVVNANPMAM